MNIPFKTLDTKQIPKTLSTIVILVLLNSVSLFLVAQTSDRANFLGIKPEVTVEPFYEKGEFDVNILPIVFQKTLNHRVDIRISSILNFGIRESANFISHYGFQFGFPIHLKKKEMLSNPSSGIYFMPGMGITRNRSEKHSNIGGWIESGYNLLISESWAISFGMQLGATYFIYDEKPNKLDDHFGIKIAIGKWF